MSSRSSANLPEADRLLGHIGDARKGTTLTLPLRSDLQETLILREQDTLLVRRSLQQQCIVQPESSRSS